MNDYQVKIRLVREENAVLKSSCQVREEIEKSNESGNGRRSGGWE